MHKFTAAAFFFVIAGCAAPLSKHPLTLAKLGTPVTAEQALAAFETPGEVSLEKVKVADWNFERSFVDPTVKDKKGNWASGSEEFGPEVYFYVLEHPAHGVYLIDAGFPKDYKKHYGLVLKWFLRNTELVVHTATADWLSTNVEEPVKAAFITHLHYDHVQGVADLDRELPIYVGPGEGSQRHFAHRIIAGPTARALKGRPPLRAWNFEQASSEEFPSMIDVFGDGALFAIHVPGHTAGSTAYLVNAADGAHLITGDGVHTVAGWVGPTRDVGAFKPSREQFWRSLDQMRALAARIEGVTIHPGHESF